MKPSNCLVDSRWVLKLTDFGLQEFKKESEDYPHHFLQHDLHQSITEDVPCKCEGAVSVDERIFENFEMWHNLMMKHCFLSGLLYRAPELLRNSSSFITGTQKGDVYSFGIILYEINGRQGPYGNSTCLTLSEILQKIVNPNNQTAPFRYSLIALQIVLLLRYVLYI